MEHVNPEIRELGNDALESSAVIVCHAFGTVAGELGLTIENCPFFPAFTTVARLKELQARGTVFFGLFVDGRQVGFVAVEKKSDDIYEMKRLAVLPGYRHGGFGGEMVRFVFDYIADSGGKKCSIGIVNDQTILKDWYIGMGFNETEVKEFDFLPFKVCLMDREIS